MGKDRVIKVQPMSDDWQEKPLNLDGDEIGSLEELKSVEQLVIHQQLSVVEAATGWDKCNKYEIWNGDTGKKIYFARENQISCCIRNYCNELREFAMPFSDAKGNEQFRLNKVRSCIQPPCCCNGYGMCCAKTCGCCGMDSNLTNLTVVKDGKNKFKVQQINNLPCGRPNFAVIDLETDSIVYEIKRFDLCAIAVCCNDVVYQVHDKNDNVVGYMTRYWAGGKSTGCGWCIECCNAGTYVLEFPTDATTEQKSALIGAQLLIDFAYYQYKNNG